MSEARNRLHWRCRRGMLELDLLLQDFLDRGYDGLPPRLQQAFGQLLERQDQELQALLFGDTIPREGDEAHVIEAIRRAAAP